MPLKSPQTRSKATQHLHLHLPSEELVVVHDSILDGAQVTVVIDSGDGLVALDRERDPDREHVDDYRSVCVRCLTASQPEIRRGLDLAHRNGKAELIEGAWA